ncbi:MAG TPA: NADP-dependent isocitrate dehydrogenase [Atribacteraceae bacterium]|nr:NADP-dependent isocitrate dehydrogenase [Atribacteraceae bacterium]
MAKSNQVIPVARGDGIGPEIMDACLYILREAGARIEPRFVEIGREVYLAGYTAGITEETWDILREHKVFYKAPITTPQGEGFKSLNVTVRKALGLYANVRPVVSYHPFVPVNHPGMDVVVIRENEEDLYAGIEHQQTPEVVQCLKLISRPGCERVVRYAFEYARAYGRKKITCMTKDNIMKLTDGLFHRVFDEIAPEYPEIESEHWIVDIGTAKLADTPTSFDMIVVPNLYGDIISDMLGQIAGSVGLAPGANIGDDYAMFEAIHGSAPRHAGKGIANPSGLLLAGVMMLISIDQADVAERVHNAWLKTIEDRVWTYDLVRRAKNTGETRYSEVGTREFAKAVVARLGQMPELLKSVKYGGKSIGIRRAQLTDVRDAMMQLDGVDVFIGNGKLSPDELGRKLEKLAEPKFRLIMISNRGQKVYPDGYPETFCTDHWRCRFQVPEGSPRLTHADIRWLLEAIEQNNLEWIKLENLYLMNGQRVYTLGQGQ